MEKKTWGNATVWGSHGLDFLVPCFIAKEKNEHTKCSAHNWFSNFAIHKSSLDAPKLYKLSQICWCEGKKTETMASKSHGFTNFPRFHWWFPSLSQRFFRLRHGFSPSGGSRRSPARRRRGGPPRAAAPRQQCWSPKPGPQGKSSRGQLTRDLLGK